MADWILIDGGNNTYYKQLSFCCFQFKTGRTGNSRILTVNLSDYSQERVKDIVSRYYKGDFGNMFIVYKEDSLFTIAECIFNYLIEK